MNLNKSRKRIKFLAIALLCLAILAGVEYITTPKQCRGNDISKLSQFCKDLRFPNS